MSDAPNPFADGTKPATDAQLRRLCRDARERLGAVNDRDADRALSSHFGVNVDLIHISRTQANEWIRALDTIMHPEMFPGEERKC